MTIQTPHNKGFTLIELIVAIGLFALIMTLSTGAYLVMINVNRHAQALSIGIDNLSFALETMTRTIRTGSNYNCSSPGGCSAQRSFTFNDVAGETITYTLSSGAVQETIGSGAPITLTDPSVTVDQLNFSTYGAIPYSRGGDTEQARVTIILAGTVSSGHGTTEPFYIETGATMRGSDL